MGINEQEEEEEEEKEEEEDDKEEERRRGKRRRRRRRRRTSSAGQWAVVLTRILSAAARGRSHYVASRVVLEALARHPRAQALFRHGGGGVARVDRRFRRVAPLLGR